MTLSLSAFRPVSAAVKFGAGKAPSDSQLKGMNLQLLDSSFLNAASSRLNDQNLAQLAAQAPAAWKRKFRVVYLQDTQVGDIGLGSLAGFSNIRALHVGKTSDQDRSTLTGTGFEALAGLKKLEVLNLRRTNMGNAQLKNLLPFTALKELCLQSTRVNYAGVNAFLQQFTGKANLKQLDVRDTAITKPQALELKKLVPECTILFGSPFDKI